MGRAIHKLSERAVATAKPKPSKDGKRGRRLSDGAGLYLTVNASGSKQWTFLSMRDGKRREMGLGGYPGVTLATARIKAQEAREQVAQGLDPIREREKIIIVTFGQAADALIESLRVDWQKKGKSESYLKKNGLEWQRSLGHYAKPLRDTPIKNIEPMDIVAILKPIWTSKRETARKTRGRIERVFDYALGHGWHEGENPAQYKRHLKDILPKRDKQKTGHFEAMPYEAIPEFITRLQAMDSLSAMALELTILTGARTSETLKAVWSEIDFDAALWSIPGHRMKKGVSHTVPLCGRALEILKTLYAARRSDFIFPGQRGNKPLSNMAMAMTMRRMGQNETVHGFRSAFRDWCGDHTSFPREVAEAALAHKIGNKTEQAYRRRDALDKRRKLMNLWESYCAGRDSEKVVKLHG